MVKTQKLKVICPNCQFKYILDLKPGYYGKELRIKCKNQSCKHPIKVKVPKAADSTPITMVVVKNDLIIDEAFVETLETEKGPKQIKALSKGKNLVGRKSGDKLFDDVQVKIDSDDLYMSRRHCLIEWVQLDNTISKISLEVVKDVKNPVYLNNNALSESDKIILRNGDIIRLGKTELVFKTIGLNNNETNK